MDAMIKADNFPRKIAGKVSEPVTDLKIFDFCLLALPMCRAAF